MATHNKITVLREYMRARCVPYRVDNDIMTGTLYINGRFACYSIYNIPWSELFSIVDDMVIYDELGYYKRLK